MNVVTISRNLLQRCGVDRAVGFTVIGRAWLAIAGILTLLFVGRYLSPVEQGYYYTFGSLIALQVFVELGLTYVIMQFASHERAHLQLADGLLVGDTRSKARLAALMQLALRWYGLVAVLLLIGLVPAGQWFFQHKGLTGSSVSWLLPWVWVVAASAGNLLVSPLFSLLEGCGFVAEVAQFRVIQAVVANGALWVALGWHAGLAAAGVFAAGNLLCSLIWLCWRPRRLLWDLWRHVSADIHLDWWREIWPFQWKIAVSWLSGYFIFQLFTPVLFAYYGPIVAGQMGMSATVAGAVSTMALAWVNTKAPRFGGLVARREFDVLDAIFNRSMGQALIVGVLGVIAVLGCVIALHSLHHPFAHRLLPPTTMALLLASTLVNLVVTAEAIYLRAFKQEPFIVIAIINAVLVAGSTYFIGRHYGALGMMVAYLLINLIVGLGLGTRIFLNMRRTWRQELLPC